MKQDWIIDLDGTLCDVTHRRKFVRSKPKNWPAFSAACIHDSVNEPVARMIDMIMKNGDRILLMSGRSIEYQQRTCDWLRKHMSWGKCVIPYEDHRNMNPIRTCNDDILLYMRSREEARKGEDDRVVKLRLLEECRKDGYDPRYAIDDRLKVVSMWAENGIFVFDVGQGEGNF